MSGPLRVAVPRAPHSPSPSPAPSHVPARADACPPPPPPAHPPAHPTARPTAHPTGVLESVVRMCTTWCAVVARSLIPTGQCTAQSSPPGSVALQLIHRMRHQSLPDHQAADTPDTHLHLPLPSPDAYPSLSVRHTTHATPPTPHHPRHTTHATPPTPHHPRHTTHFTMQAFVSASLRLWLTLSMPSEETQGARACDGSGPACMHRSAAPAELQ
jgi:hypothetical protein